MSLPPFPVTDDALALIMRAIRPDPELEDQSSLFATLEMFSELGGADPAKVAYHEHDLIEALVTEVRRLRGLLDQVNDGTHTFAELYYHRLALTAALCRALPRATTWRSRQHHPEGDPMFPGGYFIVGIDLPGGGTVTYHYELAYWDDFAGVVELEYASPWDGASPAESVRRLLGWASRRAE